MSRGLLLPTATGYRLLYEVAGELRAEDIIAAESEPLAAAVVRRVGELLPNGDLIVAASAPQTFTVTLPDGVKSMSSAALTYAVEEHVPWSAEELTAQLIHADEPRLAIVVRTSDWLPLLQSLRAAGHAVETLVPAALLRLRGLRHGRATGSIETWLIRDQDGTHALRLVADALISWRIWPTAGLDADDRETAALIAAELRMQESAGPLITAGLSPHVTESLLDAGYQVAPIDGVPTDDAWLWQGATAVGRARSRSVNLAIAGLASTTPRAALRTAMKQLLVSVALLMLVAAGALWWRSEAWRVLADEARSQHIELFRQTFPGVAVPEAIAARLRSEHRRIVGERGGETIPELPQPVMPALAAALAAHAAPFRSRFEELAIDGAALELECEFRSHDEAVQMCEQLRAHGVRLESPQLHKLDDTRVGARLRGGMTHATTGVKP